MLSYVPAFFNIDRHSIQGSVMNPTAYLHGESRIKNYTSGFIHNELAPINNAGEYHRDETAFKHTTGTEHTAKSYIRDHVNKPRVITNMEGYFHYVPAYKDDFRDYFYSDEFSKAMNFHGKEQCLDEALRNGNKTRKSMKNYSETRSAPYSIQRSVLRSPKRKKSFMVRDLLGLPGDVNHSVSSGTNYQSQNAEPSSVLTPPPEPEMPWRIYESPFPDEQISHDTTGDNKLDPFNLQFGYGEKVLETFFTYSKQKSEASYPDTTKPCDAADCRLDPLYQDPTSSPGVLSPSESSNRTPSPDSQDANSEIYSGDSATSPSGKVKKTRTIFTCTQLQRLESVFERTHYMVGPERSQLASELQLNESQVKVWFQNRRIKHRKQFHEQQQAMLSKLKESRDRDSPAEVKNDTNKENSPSSTSSEESCS